MRWIIFAGRFQPFHIGHFEVVRQSINYVKSDDILILAVIAPVPLSDKIVDRNFANIAQEHHLPERNPWSVPIRLLALSSVATYLKDNIPTLNITVSALPRPDYGWHTISEWFPGERVWIIPKAGEAFDESKAEFFTQIGESVIRIADNTKVSGRELREMWEHGKVEEMKRDLPECVQKAYFRRKT